MIFEEKEIILKQLSECEKSSKKYKDD